MVSYGMGTFSGEKCGPCLQFLFTVWKFHENPSKSRYGFLHSSSTSLVEVFKWLNSFSPMVNNLWVSKLKKADVPCWICNDYRSSGCK